MSGHGTFHRVLVRVLGLLCAAIFAVLVVDVLWGALTRNSGPLNAGLDRIWAYLTFSWEKTGDEAPRFFFHLPPQPAWTEELARFLLVWLALLGGVLAYADDRHLGVDVLVSRLHPDGRKLALLVSHLCVLGFSVAVLVVGGVELFRLRLDSGQMMTALPIRKAWFYFVLPLGGGLITLLAVGKVIATLRWQPGKEDAS